MNWKREIDCVRLFHFTLNSKTNQKLNSENSNFNFDQFHFRWSNHWLKCNVIQVQISLSHFRLIMLLFNSKHEIITNLSKNDTGQSLSLIVTPSLFKAIFHSRSEIFPYGFEFHLIKGNLFYHSVSVSILINDLE